MEKRRPGRPSKLTEDVKKTLKEAFENGHTDADACFYAGIDQTTFINWMNRGRMEKNGEYFQFFKDVQRWKKTLLDEARQSMRRLAAEGDFRAVDKMLTHYDPEWNQSSEWRLKVEGDVEHHVDGGIDVRLLDLLEDFPEAKERWLKLLIEDEDGDEE